MEEKQSENQYTIQQALGHVDVSVAEFFVDVDEDLNAK